GARYTAVRGVCDNLRHHVYVRRPAHRPVQRAGPRRDACAHPRVVLRRRDGRRLVLLQLSERYRTRVGRTVWSPRGNGRGQVGGRSSVDSAARSSTQGRSVMNSYLHSVLNVALSAALAISSAGSAAFAYKYDDLVALQG